MCVYDGCELSVCKGVCEFVYMKDVSRVCEDVCECVYMKDVS